MNNNLLDLVHLDTELNDMDISVSVIKKFFKKQKLENKKELDWLNYHLKNISTRLNIVALKINKEAKKNGII